jgi:hypothetical protein
MAKDDLYAFQGVILKCDKGTTVLPLLATPKKHTVSGLQIATVTDNIPIFNIPSFGACSITGSPCVPVAPKWLKEHDGAQKVEGSAPLLFTSYCKCQAGGTIEIFASVDDAQKALDEDIKSRVDGIPWLDGALGTALTSPIGPILDIFSDGDHDVTEGVGRGFRKGLKGTWNGLVQMATHPVETAKGLTKMAGIAVVGYGGPLPTPLYTPEQRLKDFDKIFGTDLAPTHNAMGEAIADSWDKKVVHGTTEELSEVVGQVYEGVLEAVFGTKGTGLAVKGVTTAGKFVLGAERVAAITGKIAKLQTAMKLVAGKVKGIFRVGVARRRRTPVAVDPPGTYRDPRGRLRNSETHQFERDPNRVVDQRTEPNPFNPNNPSRPSWRQSELDAEQSYPNYDTQKSFIDGEEVPYGTEGSTRPDLYRNGHSVEVKNYDVETSSGRGNLNRELSRQYNERLEHLPTGTSQTAVIDVRGQNVAPETLIQLESDIVRNCPDLEVIFMQ